MTSVRTAAAIAWGVVGATIAIVVTSNYAIWKSMTFRMPTFPNEPDVLMTQCLIAAAPQTVLAIVVSMKALSSKPQGVPSSDAPSMLPIVYSSLKGLLFTALVYCLLWYDAVAASGGGANIGLGILAMLSPLLVAFLLLRGYKSVAWDRVK